MVVVSTTGAPVSGAVVSIDSISTTTDTNGRFELTGLTTGPAKLRGSATGFDPFAADINVESGNAKQEIRLARIELFEFDNFTLHIASTVQTSRGIIVALGGPNTRAFASGGIFGAPLPAVETSLQALGLELRAMAATRGLAVLGTSRAGMPDGPESDELIRQAIQKAAALTGRTELANAPLLLYGLSAGAPEASGFTARNPQRVAGLFLKVPQRVQLLRDASALGVPTYVVLAGIDAIVDNAATTSNFRANRGAGALWALALEAGVTHHSLSATQRELTMNWMNTVLSLRLGVTASDPLRPIGESAGWLGNPAAPQVASWNSYSGEHRSASWFPTEPTAGQWLSFIRAGQP